jgi:hypothetical protein
LDLLSAAGEMGRALAVSPGGELAEALSAGAEAAGSVAAYETTPDPVAIVDLRTAERHLGAATGGWDLHDLRHSRLTHAGEDGAAEADLLNLSGHEDRRTLQRYLNLGNCIRRARNCRSPVEGGAA